MASDAKKGRPGSLTNIIVVVAVFVIAFAVANALIERAQESHSSLRTNESVLYGYDSSGEAIAMPTALASSALVPYDRADPDDGMLHDNRVSTDSYSIQDVQYIYQAVDEAVRAYGKPFNIDLFIVYPQLTGSAAGIDAVNAAIEEAAMEFARGTYLYPSGVWMEAVADNVQGSHGWLGCRIECAVMYNSEDLVSVAMNETCFAGTEKAKTVRLKTVNANPQTGQVYEFDDVVQLDADMAEAWVNVLEEHGMQDSVKSAGRADLVQGVLGEGDYAEGLTPTFFVDADGTVNLAVSFDIKGGWGFMRGWWDMRLDGYNADQLA